jgi:L-rhamnonate dehydratase
MFELAQEDGMPALPISDLTTTGVEVVYLRLPQVKAQCDSGQDALLVRVTTDVGIVGHGEVDSNPLAAKAAIEGPFSHTAATGLWLARAAAASPR